MPRRYFPVCLVIALFTTAFLPAGAQQVVHALSGKVRSINPTAKTIIIDTNDGSDGSFKDLSKANMSLLFDKEIRSRTTPVDAFKDQGAQVIVYYFGGGFGPQNERTAVALQELGSGQIEKSTGTLVRFNKHKLTIKNASGVEETFEIGDDAVAETAVGAASADKFDGEKGDQVRVLAAVENGNKTLLFVREM